MKMFFTRSLRLGATALHRIASMFNEQAHLIEHGRESGIDQFGVKPFRVLFAERRQLIRDGRLDAGKRRECGLSVDGGEIQGEGGKRLTHDGDGPIDAGVTTHDVYLDWLKFCDQRLKPGTLQPRDVRRAGRSGEAA